MGNELLDFQEFMKAIGINDHDKNKAWTITFTNGKFVDKDDEAEEEIDVNVEEEIDDDEIPFCDGDCDTCELNDEDEEENLPLYGIPDIVKIVYNAPATIVFWEDGEKTVVKCAEGQIFDRYAGFCAAVCKRLFGSTAAAKDLMEECDEDNWKLWAEEEKLRKREEKAQAEKKAQEEKARHKEISMDQLISAFVEALKIVAEKE